MNKEKSSPSNKVAKTTTKSLAQMNPKEKVAMAEDKFIKAFKDKGEAQRMWEKESGFVLQLFHNNPYLTKMDPVSIVTAIHNVALTGLSLNPELKLGYLVPRKGKLYFQSSYAGKREILLRAGIVQDVWVNLVYEKDEFDVEEGSNRRIYHKPKPFGDKGEIMGGYWCAKLLNGQKPFGIMDIKRIEEIKSRSEAVKAGKGSPWDTDFEEMAKKTILNWAFKSLPKTDISDSVLKAMEEDSKLDNDEFEDWKKKQEQLREDDFSDDEPDDFITEAEVVEEKEEKLPEPPPEEPKEEPKPMDRIKENKDKADSYEEQEREAIQQESEESEGASPELIEAVKKDMEKKGELPSKDTQSGELFPKVD